MNSCGFYNTFDQMEFVSNNIMLTGVTSVDAEDINAYMQDKEIYEGTLRIPFPYNIEYARIWIDDNHRFEEEHGFRKNYAIRDNGGRMLGSIGLHFNFGYDADKSEFGYWLGKPHRNKGTMTEAIKLFAQLAKQQYKLNSLEAHVFDFNIASQKVLRKAGFTEYELIADYYIKDEQHISAIKFAMVL
jgi:ribosomal-protein-alanine N-acetyltransferase